MSGLRYNNNKIRHELISPVATKYLAQVMTKGAIKYPERNWEKGMHWTTVLASLKRHINSFELGEDIDQETGLPHIALAHANTMILADYYTTRKEFDDRVIPTILSKKLAVDIDDVVCDLTGYLSKKCNKEFISWKDPDFISIFNHEKKEKDFWINLPLLDNSFTIEPMCYITKRECDDKITEDWIIKNKLPVAPVINVYNKTYTKADVLQCNNISIFVDDNIDNWRECKDKKIFCYLYDQPHNRRYNVGHHRITSLKEAV